MNLQDYEGVKFSLAEIVRSAVLQHQAADGRENPMARDIFARLAEDRFNLVVAGRFNRGKTSLMNALLSTDRLPIGILPLTSVITTVSYGSEGIATIEYADRSIPDRVPLESLREHITQEGNPGNIRRVTTARVQFPAELLRRGFHFIDTPGVGSAIAENTETTRAFLPQADAVLLVTSFESPLSADEVQMIEAVRTYHRRMFFVVNKSDLASEGERKGVLAYVRSTLRAVGIADPDIFEVCCRQDRLEGISGLAEQLSRYMIEDKRCDFLRTMCERIATLLEQLRGTESERSKLLAIVDALGFSGVYDGAPSTFSSGGAFATCALCDTMTQAVVSFLSAYQYDLIASSATRDELAEVGGFCEMHAWQYNVLAGSRGACIAMSAVLSRVATRLRDIAAKQSQGGSGGFADILASREHCPACAIMREAEQSAIASAAANACENPGAAVYCLAHFVRTVDALSSDVAALRLAESQADAVARVADDMRRFVVKFDGTRRYLMASEERSADQRGLTILAGSRGKRGIAAGP